MDYEKIQQLLTAAVATGLDERMPQLEENILERMAADERFKGPSGENGKPGQFDVNNLTPEDLDALAAKLLASGKLAIGFRKKVKQGDKWVTVDEELIPIGDTLVIEGDFFTKEPPQTK